MPTCARPCHDHDSTGDNRRPHQAGGFPRECILAGPAVHLDDGRGNEQGRHAEAARRLRRVSQTRAREIRAFRVHRRRLHRRRALEGPEPLEDVKRRHASSASRDAARPRHQDAEDGRRLQRNREGASRRGALLPRSARNPPRHAEQGRRFRSHPRRTDATPKVSRPTSRAPTPETCRSTPDTASSQPARSSSARAHPASPPYGERHADHSNEVPHARLAHKPRDIYAKMPMRRSAASGWSKSTQVSERSDTRTAH